MNHTEIEMIERNDLENGQRATKHMKNICQRNLRIRPDRKPRKGLIPFRWISFGLTLFFPASATIAALIGADPMDSYNVVWTTPSEDSSGSMPIGNGDIGLNVWVEKSGDLLFYIGKTDAWDEHSRLLKLGRVRVRLSPNPFQANHYFRQELRLRQGEIRIVAGKTNEPVQIRVWVDANQPLVRVEAECEQEFSLSTDLELWRKEVRPLTGAEVHGVDGFTKNQPPFSYPDVIVTDRKAQLVWYHRNQLSLWPATLRHQGLEARIDSGSDPLLNRTFGGVIEGEGLSKTGPVSLRSVEPRKRFELRIPVLAEKTETVDEWLQQMDSLQGKIEAAPIEKAREEHLGWWSAFWDRSWVRIRRVDGEALVKSGFRDETREIMEGHVLQRFINACGGRGRYPIKFNGTIFTVDTVKELDPDFRRWGGCYWFQNTRLPYWPMLASGDFDLMQPLFRMYRDALDLAKARTALYHNHGGAFFPETMYFWGAYANGELGFGWERENEPLGRPANTYIRYYWSGGLELAAMMLDYYAFTRDDSFLTSTLLPIAKPVIEFYDKHYPREPTGEILFVPSQALETWRDCENPMPVVAGLRVVLSGLLSLPASRTDAGDRVAWTRLQSALPAIPVRSVDGKALLAPAENFKNRQNSENPELYAVFPYRLFGVGKPDLELARRSFMSREFKGNRGWQQDDTQAALLGLVDSARGYVSGRFSEKHPGSRFPAFWGPNFDWVPDQSHGGNGVMALQSMLLQWDGNRIFLFPAWPEEWDVDFKLRAPGNTFVEASFRNGKVSLLKVSPPERAGDVIDFSSLKNESN